MCSAKGLHKVEQEVDGTLTCTETHTEAHSVQFHVGRCYFPSYFSAQHFENCSPVTLTVNVASELMVISHSPVRLWVLTCIRCRFPTLWIVPRSPSVTSWLCDSPEMDYRFKYSLKEKETFLTNLSKHCMIFFYQKAWSKMELCITVSLMHSCDRKIHICHVKLNAWTTSKCKENI